MQRTITLAQAEAAWDILVRLAGAHNDKRGWNRESFIWGVSLGRHLASEYRFEGALGFGGKFRNNGNNDDIPHVDCYSDDLTPKREQIIAETNAALRELFSTQPTPEAA
jgi:hypothetical protein